MAVVFNNIVGNQKLKQKLSEDISTNNISHAYIIEGPEGTGKHTIAKTIAMALSCESYGDKPCGKCVSCKKILEGNCIDIITVKPEGGKISIGVDAARYLKSDICIAPNDLNVKVYIIEEADHMTVQAQNAILLSLEEPPSYILFFLLCENSSLLLETVRSRAPILRTERLDNSLIDEYLEKNSSKETKKLKKSDTNKYNEFLFICNGSIGKAITLIEDSKACKKIFTSRKLVTDMVTAITSNRKDDLLTLIYSVPTKRNETSEFLFLFREAIRDLILLQKSETVNLCFFYDRDEVTDLSERITTRKLINIFDAISEAIENLTRNANVRLTLINMVSRFITV